MRNCAFEPIIISQQEFAAFVHAVNTLYFSRFAGHAVAYIAIGNYGYRFEIIEFGEYKILSRKVLE